MERIRRQRPRPRRRRPPHAEAAHHGLDVFALGLHRRAGPLRGDVRLEVRVEARRVAPLPADGARSPGAAPRVAPTAVAPAAPVGTASECRVDGVRLRRGGSLETHGHAFDVLWDQARGVELEVPRPLRAPPLCAWRCEGLQYYGRAGPVVVAVLLRNRGVIVRRAVRRRAVVVWSDVMRLLRMVLRLLRFNVVPRLVRVLLRKSFRTR